MFFSVKELELRKAHFSVTFPPGEIEFFDPALRQVQPLEAEGTAELLEDTEGEIRVRGRLTVTMEADCDRCLESAHYPIESEFDLFYRPAPPAHSRKVAEEIEIDEREAELAFYEGKGLGVERHFTGAYFALHAHTASLRRNMPGNLSPVWAEQESRPVRLSVPSLADDRWEALKSFNYEKEFEMPNPKRRHSKRRTSTRRAHDHLHRAGISECPNCHEPKLPHRACPNCGQYKGREVIEVAAE